MARSIRCLTIVLLASLSCVAQPTVSIAGLSVFDGAVPFDKFKHTPLWVGKGGTNVVLAVTGGADARVIDLEERKSSITITDDQGNDLLAPKDGKKSRFRRGPFDMQNPVTADGKTMIVPVKAPGAAPRGGKITFKGSLSVVTAAATKKHVAQVDLKPGPVALQGLEVRIESAKMDKDWNDEAVFKVQVAMKGEAATGYAGIRFLDAAGKVIESRQSESMRGGRSRTIGFVVGKEKIASCALELSLWDGRKVVKVPFDLTVASPL